jgi:hypothetical protein
MSSNRAKNSTVALPEVIEEVVPSFVDVTDPNFLSSMRFIVYDHADERFINNANSERRYALHLRCKDISIESVHVTGSYGVLLGRLDMRYLIPLMQVEEKLLDIINAAPSFTERDSSEDSSVLTSKSFVSSRSNGNVMIRFEIDLESENRSLFFEGSEEEETPISNLKQGMMLDAVVQILADMDEDRREVIFTAVVEEARVSQPEIVIPKPKRKPTILSGRR